MNRWWKIPGAVVDLTLGTMIVVYQLTLQAREKQQALPPPKPRPQA
jgi:hypothetical protein